MKIHTVVIENLNSLYGRHEIDFDSDLDQAPLFLIVGPTGAGKSTIMDAISLALFGMTPRLSGGHGQDDTDSRMIMSRGTGRCFAEVVFSKQVPGAARTFFRARWEAWRSRDKPDGSFQTARRSLTQEDNLGLEAQVLVSDTKRKIWGPAFEAVLEGMEPAEFQRSMLLAQGQFSAFLRASVSERAQILERLTSTEQYRVIGGRAMESYREARSEVDKLRAGVGAIEILDAAQLEELVRTLDLSRARTTAAEKRFRHAQTLLDWARRDAGLKNDLADATERLTKERRRWDAQTANRERLAESNRCADAGEVLRRRKALERDRLQLTGAIDDAQETRDAQTEALKRATELERERTKAHDTHARTLEEAKPKFALAVEAQEANRRVAADGLALAAEVSAIEALTGRLAPVRIRLEALREARESDDKSNADVSERERATRDRLATLCGERTPAEHGRWISEERDRFAEHERRLATLTQRLDDLDEALQAELSAVADQSALESQTAEIERERHRAQDAKTAATTHHATAQKLVETTERVIELEEKRDALGVGEECPLCGSTTHPYTVDPKSDRKAHDAHTSAERDLEEATRALEVSTQISSAAAVAISTHEARVQSGSATVAREGERVSVLRVRIEHAGESDGISDREGLDRTRATIVPGRQALDEQTEAFTSAEEAARNAASEAEALRTARAERDHERVAAEASLRELEETMGVRTAERTHAEKQLAGSRSDAIAALAQVDQPVPEDASVEEFEGALLAAFGGNPPEAARAALERAVGESAKALDDAKKELAAIRVVVAGVDAQMADRKAGLKRLLERIQKTDRVLREAVEELGLSDVVELEPRVLSSTERDLLQRNVDDVRSRFEQATGRADALAQQLAEHREVQPDGVLDEEAFEALETEDREAAGALEAGRQEVARLAAKLEEQERARSRRAGLIAILDAAEKKAALWNEMRLLIGSNDGGAFQRFAQTLNLTELVARANVRLRELEPRYELVVATDSSGNPELAFAVRDHEHGGRVRPQTTLSGGETFLVSLALALALSEYRQTQMPIETLLLDEGFGTLDAETLDIAMSALERLCATGGTQIGVISHVEGLRERINAQILVEKLGGGRSRLRTTL